MKEELIKIADQLATVRDWSKIPEETHAGINGVIDSMNELIGQAKEVEEYKVIAVSTSHVTKRDVEILSEYPRGGMIHDTSYGFLIKLYDEPQYNDFIGKISLSLSKVIDYAMKNKYRMIELDSDGKVYDKELFDRHEW